MVYGLHEAAILTDGAHKVLAANQQALDFLSVADEQALRDQDVGQFLNKASAGWPCDAQQKHLVTLQTNDQPLKEAELFLSKFQTQQGDFYVGVMQDVTLVRQLKDRLEKAENRLDDMMGNLPVTLFQMELKPNGILKFPYISKEIANLTGVDRDGFRDNPDKLFSMMRPSDQVQLWRKLKKAARKGISLDEELCLKLSDTVTLWLRLFANIRKDTTGSTIWDGAVIDITGQHLLDERLHYLAYHDETTQMPNRLALEEHLAALFAEKQDSTFAVMALAVDRLELVNETLGGETANHLLETIANHLKDALSCENVFLAHLRADVFCIVMPQAEDDRDVAALAEGLLKTMKIPFAVGTRRLDVSVSMGISLSYRDGDCPESLLMNADAALRRALQTTPGGYRFYVEEMNTRALRVLAYENRLRKGIKNKEFLPFFQPLIDVKSGKIAGMEALVRWQHPRLGLVSPAEFIPVAEEAGLIGELCHQVLMETCLTAKRWLDAGFDPVPLAVNISWRQFAQPERLMMLMSEVLKETGLPPEMLELELTESSVMEEPDSAIRTLNDLRDFGVMASIDDFGTGYSSLSYLKRLPISKLKIDRAFIHEVNENERDAAIVDAIIRLARALGLKTVAEGIETPEQLAYIREQGCDLAQGFYFSKPLPAHEMEKLLEQNRLSLSDE